MDKKSLKQRLDAVNFISNNGRVLRTINILRYQPAPAVAPKMHR